LESLQVPLALSVNVVFAGRASRHWWIVFEGGAGKGGAPVEGSELTRETVETRILHLIFGIFQNQSE
jgi:hypothetical protein